MTTLERFKLSSITWDGDKDPGGFQAFEDTMGAFVRSTAGGAALENMLDSKLERRSVNLAASPSFLLNDEDFAVPVSPGPREFFHGSQSVNELDSFSRVR